MSNTNNNCLLLCLCISYKFHIQDVELSTDQLQGEKDVTLKFVKFQDVQNIQLFVKDNQNDEEVTEIEYLEIFGCPVATTNMKELKKKG